MKSKSCINKLLYPPDSEKLTFFDEQRTKLLSSKTYENYFGNITESYT